MNAEKLYRILTVVQEEIQSLQIQTYVQQIVSNLQKQINQPQPSQEQAIANALQELRRILPSARSNSFNPTWQRILQELDVIDLLGDRLLNKINDIFKQNQITVTIASQEMGIIYERLNGVTKAITQILSGLKYFKIIEKELSFGEFEFNVIIPRSSVKNQFEELIDELSEIRFVLRSFNEATCYKYLPIKISTISASDFGFSFFLDPKVAVCLAVAIERIVALYKQILEIRKLRNELNRAVPPETLAPVDEHINKIISEGIKKYLDENFEKYCIIDDEGRRNEARNSISLSLNKIANRIDRGYNFEIRTAPIPAKIQDESQELVEAVAIVDQATKTLEFMRVDGDPILALPEKIKSEPSKNVE